MELVEEHLAGGGMCVMAAHQDIEVRAPMTRIRLQ
jgi:ABC-type transport system involved in cytochrome c biogenesis ATPase subunit